MMILHIEVYPALYRADVYIGLPLLEAAKVVHEFMFERYGMVFLDSKKVTPLLEVWRYELPEADLGSLVALPPNSPLKMTSVDNQPVLV